MATDRYGHYTSDITRVARSGKLAAVADDTYNVLRFSSKTFIFGFWLNVSVAYVAGAPSITVGYTYNGTSVTNGVMTNDVSKPLVTGFKKAYNEHLTSIGDGFYTADKKLIVTITVDDDVATTEGTVELFVLFGQIY